MKTIEYIAAVEEIIMPKHTPAKRRQNKVKKVLGEQKRGKLKSSSGKKVTSKKQAVAIGLSKARAAEKKRKKRK